MPSNLLREADIDHLFERLKTMELNYNNKRFLHRTANDFWRKFYSVEVIRNLFVPIGGKGYILRTPSLKTRLRWSRALL